MHQAGLAQVVQAVGVEDLRARLEPVALLERRLAALLQQLRVCSSHGSVAATDFPEAAVARRP